MRFDDDDPDCPDYSLFNCLRYKNEIETDFQNILKNHGVYLGNVQLSTNSDVSYKNNIRVDVRCVDYDIILKGYTGNDDGWFPCVTFELISRQLEVLFKTHLDIMS